MNVLVVDDHELVRRGLAHVVQDCLGGAEVDEAANPTEALEAIRKRRPDVVLLDVRLGDEHNGLDVLREIKASWTDLPVIMLTSYDHGGYVRQAMEEGAAGYLLKDASPSDLAQAVQVALAGGGNVMSPRVVQSLFDTDAESTPEEEARSQPEPPLDEPSGVHLTNRERQILERIVLGQPNSDIAHELGVSEKTVKTHLRGMYRKLGVTNRTQAAMAGITMGLRPGYLPPEPRLSRQRAPRTSGRTPGGPGT